MVQSKIHTLIQNVIEKSKTQNYSWLNLRNSKSHPECSRSNQYHYITIQPHETIPRVNFRKQHIGLEQ